jgi:ATP-dependent RNA helicase DeaD
MSTIENNTIASIAFGNSPVASIPPVPPVGFEGLGLPPVLLSALAEMQYKEPTEIQSRVIPEAIAGSDILGSAQTGTGKTAAFMLPILSRLLSNQSTMALVLAPTRELATQIHALARQLIGKRVELAGISTVRLIGGEDIVRQFRDIERCRRLRLIVGTPGRVYDHMMRRKIDVSAADMLVLDETDRMLDLGFAEQITDIVKHMPQNVKDMPKKRQTMMFSATVAPRIRSLSGHYMVDPVSVAVAGASQPVANIKQEVMNCPTHESKFDLLLDELKKRTGSIIIFARTRLDVADLSDRLEDIGHSVCCIHGDLRQTKRDRVIRGFRDKRFRIMVATDVASRGLDIAHIEHVINYDLPQCPEDYVHRIGRTARAGATGSALIFVVQRGGEGRRWDEIRRFIDPEYKKEQAVSGARRRPGGGGGGFFGNKRNHSNNSRVRRRATA